MEAMDRIMDRASSNATSLRMLIVLLILSGNFFPIYDNCKQP